jgi:hypothetical protein
MDPPDGIPIDKDPKWVIDSGASMHFAHDVSSFQALDLNPSNPLPTITFGNNDHLQATGVASVKFILPSGNGIMTQTRIHDDVLYMPQAASNLFSVKQAAVPGEAVFSRERSLLFLQGPSSPVQFPPQYPHQLPLCCYCPRHLHHERRAQPSHLHPILG